MHEISTTDPLLLARLAPHLLAVDRDVTCARIAGELEAAQEILDTLDAVAAIAQQHAQDQPTNRNVLVASLRLGKEANDAFAHLATLKSAWAAAAIEAILKDEVGTRQMPEMSPR